MALIERDTQIAALREAADRVASGNGSSVSIRGRAGTGKTSLLHASPEWLPASFEVVHLACRREQQNRPYALLEQLGARGVFPGRSELLARLAEGDTITEDQAKEGLYWTISSLAESAPVLLAIDDVHWIDPASQVVVSDLLQRIEELPCLVVLAARRLQAGSSPEHRALLDQANTQLVLRELSPQGVAEIVKQRFPPAPESFSIDCHAATAGNPFLLVALLDAIEALGLPPDSNSIDRAAPRGATRVVSETIGTMAPEVQALADAIALLGNGRDIDVTAKVAGLERSVAIDAGGELIARGILSSSGDATFIHDLIRVALLHAMDPVARDQWLSRAVEIAAAHGWDDLDLSHIVVEIQSPLDDSQRNVLEAAARGSLAAGSPAIARRLAERASRDVPEPTPDQLSLLARAIAATDPPSAVQHLETAVRASRTADLLEQLADAYVSTGRHGDARLLFREAAELERADHRRHRNLMARALAAAGLSGEIPGEVMNEWRSFTEHDQIPLTPGDRTFLATVAMTFAFLTGTNREESVSMALRAWDDGAVLDGLSSGDETPHLVTGVLNCAEEHEKNLEVTSALMAKTRDDASLPRFASACYVRMCPLLEVGQVEEIVACGTTTIEAERRGWRQYAHAARGHLALGLIELDDFEGAAAALEGAPTDSVPGLDTVMGSIAEGRLAYERGDFAEAAQLLDASQAQLDAAGFGAPDILPFPHFHFDALWRSGRREDASAFHETYEAKAKRWAAPRVLARILRMQSVLEPDTRLERLEEAVKIVRTSDCRLESLWLELELGEVYAGIDKKSDAREILHHVGGTAETLGCRLLARKAFAALASAGGRPRRLSTSGLAALTPTEKQIASLAAEGKSNGEIAESLFVSVRTVKSHLTNVFRKLEIERRVDLLRFFK
jgi:DNA-binding CsgD family transcriptional regulator/tetratricopeptide (TPR) repeat protein